MVRKHIEQFVPYREVEGASRVEGCRTGWSQEGLLHFRINPGALPVPGWVKESSGLHNSVLGCDQLCFRYPLPTLSTLSSGAE